VNKNFVPLNLLNFLVPRNFKCWSTAEQHHAPMRFSCEKRKEALMRKLALGIVAAATLLTAAAPAMAQVGFYAGPGGVGIGIAPPPCYGYPYGYYDYYGGPGVVVAPGWQGHWRYHHRH
jgi:hypothetical protein